MASSSVRLTRTGAMVIAAGVTGLILYWVAMPLTYRIFEEKISMKDLLSVSVDLARMGGNRVKAIREDPSRIKETVKGETKEGKKEFVTAADLESHRIMHGGLLKVFPNLKIISEEHDESGAQAHVEVFNPDRSLPEVVSSLESSEDIRVSDITVWIDPLDATQEYTENLTEFVTTMICVAVKGQPVIGVIHQPFKGETTWGYVGHGRSKNLPSPKTNDQDSKLRRFIVSRSHAGDVNDFITSSKSFGKDAEIIPAGGAGYKVLKVLHGDADAYVHVTAIKKWDICAANALIAATNGVMTTLKGGTIDYSDSKNVVNSDGLLVTRNFSGLQHESFMQEFSVWMLKRKGGKKT